MRQNVGRRIVMISWVIDETEHTIEPTEGREFICEEMFESQKYRTFWAVLKHEGRELSRYKIADLSAIVWEDDEDDGLI